MQNKSTKVKVILLDNKPPPVLQFSSTITRQCPSVVHISWLALMTISHYPAQLAPNFPDDRRIWRNPYKPKGINKHHSLLGRSVHLPACNL